MPKQRSVDIDTARAEYAQWFVKRHYLRKRRPYTPGLNAWQVVEHRGYIRYYLLKGHGDVEYDELDTTQNDWNALTYVDDKDKSWFRIDIEDLDDPRNDRHSVARIYREYRKQAADWGVYQWLLAEAEHHTLVNEAWLRAYGVDVVDD